MGDEGGKKCTGGVEFKVFLEVGVAEVALGRLVSLQLLLLGWAGGYLCIYVYDNIIASVRHRWATKLRGLVRYGEKLQVVEAGVSFTELLRLNLHLIADGTLR